MDDNQDKERCPHCGSTAGYPLLINLNPRSLCAHAFHNIFLDLLQPTWRRFWRLWLNRL